MKCNVLAFSLLLFKTVDRAENKWIINVDSSFLGAAFIGVFWAAAGRGRQESHSLG